MFCILLMLTCPCSAALYVVKVLRGTPPAEAKDEQTADGAVANEVCFYLSPALIH